MIENFRIRMVAEQDLPTLLEWRNHYNVRRFMLTQHLISLEEHRKWFQRVSLDPARTMLIVEDEGGGIGYVQFSRIARGGVADWGFYLRPDLPRGRGRMLGTMALSYAFRSMNLHKVCGQALAFNLASIALHKRLGFSQEGVLREQYLIKGTYQDLECFGLLARDWNHELLVQEKDE